MTARRASVADKRRTFRRLHASGCFVIPNPWDLGSARFLQSLGFKALATSSSAFAWSQGRPDGGVGLQGVLEHLETLAASTDVPLNADFQDGFGADAAELARNVGAAVATGIAGLSIEDATGNADQPLYPLRVAVERIRSARHAIDRVDADTMLIGRAECFLVGPADLEETIARLCAYARAGADCVYAPGIRTREQIEAIVTAVAPTPVNVLMGTAVECSIPELAALGVRRVSVGGSLARVAWGAFTRAARALADQGSCAAFAEAMSSHELNQFFSKDQEQQRCDSGAP